MYCFKSHCDPKMHGLSVNVANTSLGLEGNSATTITLVGTAVSNRAPRFRVEFSCVGHELGGASRDIPVGHLKKYAPDALSDAATSLPDDALCGFAAQLSKLSLTPGQPIDIHINYGSGPKTWAGSCYGIKEYDRSFVQRSRWKPVLVAAMGRSGTTLLMSYLAAHPEIAATPVAQYEFRLASYLWRAAQILTTPANPYVSLHPDGFETSMPHAIGYNPFWFYEFLNKLSGPNTRRWLENSFVATTLGNMVRSFDDYCDALATDLCADKAHFIAEKVLDSSLNAFVSNVFEKSYQIYLVRDFRDVVASAIAFNSKRGTRSFGLGAARDQIHWLHALAAGANQIAASCEVSTGKALVIHYEDLVLETRGELRRIFEYLGADCSFATIDGIIEAQRGDRSLRGHETSSSPMRSIGRWRNDLRDEEKAIVENLFAPALKTFGYGV